MSTRYLICEQCGSLIADTEDENFVFGEEPYPFDDGLGLCFKCADFNAKKDKKDAYLSRLGKIKRVLSDRTARKIDGMLVDVFTASAIIAVYESLSEENQRKFASMSSVKAMSDMAWKLVSR